MKTSPALPRLPAPVLQALLACACMVLAGCSSRDEVLSEKIAAAEAAAKRAESAAVRAEAAARSAENPGQAPLPHTEIEEAEPTIEDPSPREDPPPAPPPPQQGVPG